MTNDAYRAHRRFRSIRDLSIILEIKRLELKDMFNKAQGCGSFSSELKVQTSPRGDAMDLAVAKLIELEDDYQKVFMEYMGLKEAAMEMLEELTGDEEAIVKLYYFQNMTDERIAGVIHLSRSRITQLRHQALGKIGRRMKD